MKTYRIPVLTVYEEFALIKAESPEQALRIFNADEDCDHDGIEFAEDSNPIRVLSSRDASIIKELEMLGWSDDLYIPVED